MKFQTTVQRNDSKFVFTHLVQWLPILDFVENVFGNAGGPAHPENDAALDPEHWSGTTGCVMLSPHLLKYTKKEVGLPHWDAATKRQRRDGMAWKNESEKWQCLQDQCSKPPGHFITLRADN